MKYSEFISLLSLARINKYSRVAKGNKVTTLQLYHHNLQLSQRMFGVIGMFEVILRNAVHRHYSSQFNDVEWIVHQIQSESLLAHEANEITEIKAGFERRGVYSADKMVAAFSFGFWTYLFTKRNYRIGGKTLLQIFPNRCKGLKQTDVYRDLTSIREFRNRIAHHEPICFDSSKELSTQYVRHHYQLICQYIEYMGYNPKRVLKIVEKPDSVLNEIDRLARIL